LKDRPAKRHGIHDETMETKQVAPE
jgi:hypothetical protein